MLGVSYAEGCEGGYHEGTTSERADGVRMSWMTDNICIFIVFCCEFISATAGSKRLKKAKSGSAFRSLLFFLEFKQSLKHSCGLLIPDGADLFRDSQVCRPELAALLERKFPFIPEAEGQTVLPLLDVFPLFTGISTSVPLSGVTTAFPQSKVWGFSDLINVVVFFSFSSEFVSNGSSVRVWMFALFSNYMWTYNTQINEPCWTSGSNFNTSWIYLQATTVVNQEHNFFDLIVYPMQLAYQRNILESSKRFFG